MIKDSLKTEKGSRCYDFTPELTEEMILNQENYISIRINFNETDWIFPNAKFENVSRWHQ